MIDLLSTASSLPSEPVPAVAAGLRTGAAVDFGQTLGAFLDARDAAAVPSPLSPDRQALADDGKDLPEAGSAPAASADDVGPAAPDPIWAMAPILPPVPLPFKPLSAAVDALAARDSGAGAMPVAASAPAERPDAPAHDPSVAASRITPAPVHGLQPVAATPIGTAPQPLAAMPSGDIVAAGAPIPIPIPASVPPAMAPSAAPAHAEAGATDPAQRDRTDADARIPVRRAAPAPVPNIAVSATPQPARQVFAAAIAAASRWQERAGRADSDAVTATPISAPEALRSPAVAPPEAAHDAPLDLAGDHGLQQLIDRIESLRDEASAGAEARDTRIRLVPDALGGLDIAVRKQGEQVHVHFTAERAATQALLVDAQPRLTELAAARGVRLAETSIATGSPSQQGGGANPQPRPSFTPRAPAATAAVAEEPTTDHRLA